MANWISHMLCKNCLLKHATEGKLEGKIRDKKMRKKM